jgi:hypothetical protein
MQARCYLPNNGLSEVTGIVADAMFKNMVILRRIVTPGMKLEFYCIVISLLLFCNLTYTNNSAKAMQNTQKVLLLSVN